jgi:uncharacterized membrane protein YidH (DUF202 family)
MRAGFRLAAVTALSPTTGALWLHRLLCFNAMHATQPAPPAPGSGGISGDQPMNSIKLVALLLIAAGVLALAYGGFSYTKDTTAVKLGPLELTVQEKKTVNIPLWAGIGAIVVGGALLLVGSKRG